MRKRSTVRSVQAIGRGGHSLLTGPPDDDGSFEADSVGEAEVLPEPTPSQESRGLPVDALDRLRRAFDELAECDRVLSTLTAADASSGIE